MTSPEQDVQQAARDALFRESQRDEPQELVDGLRAELNETPHK